MKREKAPTVVSEQIPYDKEAESCVVASALVNPAIIPSLSTIVEAHDFWWEPHRWLWESCLALQDSVNQVTVADDLRRKSRLKEIGGAAYIAKLTTELPTSVGAEYYAEIVKRDSTYRQMITAAGQIQAKGDARDNDVQGVMSRAITLVQAVARQGLREGPMSIREILNEALDASPVQGGGVLTPWPPLNYYLGALRSGSVNVVAARPSKGKSSFAIHVLHDAIMKGKRALLFSLEMSRTQLVQRAVACATGINSRRIEGQQMDDTDQAKVNEAYGVLGDTAAWIQDRVRGIEQIEMEARAHQLTHGLDILAIDYLQLVGVNWGRERNKVQEVTEVSRRVKLLALELGIPVLLLSQLNRQSEGRADRRPVLGDLRDSGAVEQDADTVMMIHDGTARPESIPHAVDLIVAKNRLGDTGSVPLTFLPAQCRFRVPA